MYMVLVFVNTRVFSAGTAPALCTGFWTVPCRSTYCLGIACQSTAFSGHFHEKPCIRSIGKVYLRRRSDRFFDRSRARNEIQSQARHWDSLQRRWMQPLPPRPSRRMGRDSSVAFTQVRLSPNDNLHTVHPASFLSFRLPFSSCLPPVRSSLCFSCSSPFQ